MSQQQQQAAAVQAAQAANQNARMQILGYSQVMMQPQTSVTVTPASVNNSIVFQPRNVGLITGFYLEITATLNNSGSVTLSPTVLNIANLFTNITFTDLNNNVRINTTGWHLNAVNSARARRPYGAAVTTDDPIGYGSVMTPFSAPATIAASASGTLKMVYRIPVAYNPNDPDPSKFSLQGAIYSNVVNATSQIALSVNPNPVAVSTADTVNAIYQGAAGAAGSITSITVTLYQEYLDQLPSDNNGPILPWDDLRQVYELRMTNLTGMTVGNDFAFAYPNYKSFLSTILLFDNGGVLNAGTDLNYITMQAANTTNFFKLTPNMVSERTRNWLGADMPKGMLYFDHRRSPVNTQNYGNMNLFINPSSVSTSNNGAILYVGVEDLAVINTLQQASSLPNA